MDTGKAVYYVNQVEEGKSLNLDCGEWVDVENTLRKAGEVSKAETAYWEKMRVLRRAEQSKNVNIQG